MGPILITSYNIETDKSKSFNKNKQLISKCMIFCFLFAKQTHPTWLVSSCDTNIFYPSHTIHFKIIKIEIIKLQIIEKIKKKNNIDCLIFSRKQFESNIPHCPCRMPGTLQSHRRLVQPRPSGPSEPPGPSLLP